MALEASHIRFALDIKDQLEVKDLKRYIPGILYPDSRYVTKIDRDLTHSQEMLVNHYSYLDDFGKGCYAHVLYDKLLREYTNETLAEMFLDIENFQDTGEEAWIRLTALKILQDMDDCKKYDIGTYLPYLNYVESLNGEEPAILLKYNKYFQHMYALPQYISIESYYKMWKFLGIGEDLAMKVKVQTLDYKKNKTIENFLKTVYKQTLKMF